MFRGYGYSPEIVEGDDPQEMHQLMAATMERCINQIRTIQSDRSRTGSTQPPQWPMIILRTPKGWTAPREVDGHYIEGFWRAHQVPIADVPGNAEHLKIVQRWMESYRPHELFDQSGGPRTAPRAASFRLRPLPL